MSTELSKQDLHLILESLNYSKKSFEEYDKYLSNEFKQKKIQEVDNLIMKIKKIIKEK